MSNNLLFEINRMDYIKLKSIVEKYYDSLEKKRQRNREQRGSTKEQSRDPPVEIKLVTVDRLVQIVEANGFEVTKIPE